MHKLFIVNVIDADEPNRPVDMLFGPFTSRESAQAWADVSEREGAEMGYLNSTYTVREVSPA